MQGSWKDSTTQTTLGIEVVLGLLLPGYLGHLADAHFGTRPLFILLGFVLGLAHGVRAVVRVVREGDEQAARAAKEMKRKRAEYYDQRP